MTDARVEEGRNRLPGWVRALLIVGYAAVLLELASFLALSRIVYPRDPSLLYQPTAIARPEYEEFMMGRHPMLGWPVLKKGESPNEIRPRTAPASARDSGVPCVSTYGDSFTFGDEVDDSSAWSYRLSDLLECGVANFGVSGYGTDQAFLRARMNRADEAGVTILGIYPYNILRNVNRYRRYLAGPSSSFGFKPRFVLEADSLRLVDIPSLSYAELLEELNRPGTHLVQESFLPGSASGPPFYRFPFTVALGRLALSDTFITRLKGRPSWTRFLDLDHPSHALDVTVRIADAFGVLAASRSQQSLILIFPTPSSYDMLSSDGDIVTEVLVDRLKAQGLQVLDLHLPIRDRLDGQSFCALLTQPGSCGGHFNEAGNALIARIVADHLDALFLLEQN